MSAQDTFAIPYLKDVYTAYDQLKVLDMCRTGYSVVDFTPGKRKIYWANEALCNWMLKCPQDKVQDINIGEDGSSQGVNDLFDLLYRKVQIGQEVHSYHKTVYFGKEPTTVTTTSQPIRLKMPGSNVEKVFALHSTNLEDSNQDGGDTDLMATYRFASELLYNVDVQIQAFGQESYQLSYRNHFAESFYSDLLPTKYGVEEWLDTCCFTQPEVKASILSNIKALSFGSPPLCFDCYFVPASASTASTDSQGRVWHRVKVLTIRDPNSSDCKLLVQQSDVTSQVQQSELQRTNQLKDRFLAVVSHELRTPLNGILGLSSSLIANPNCPEWALRSLLTIEESANRLGSLVSDILETTQCIEAKLELEVTELNLAEIIQHACELLRPRLRKGVRLISRVGPVVFQGDKARMLKVFSHLIDNAVKFTLVGEIELKAAVVEGKAVRVSVSDTGCGIAADKLQTIWDAFEQGDMSETRKFAGTGLGLAMVKSLVKAHGGEVAVKSEVGKGSVFSLGIPLTQGPKSKDGKAYRRASMPKLSRVASMGTIGEPEELEDTWVEVGDGEADERIRTEREEVGEALGQLASLQAQLERERERAAALQRKVQQLEQELVVRPPRQGGGSTEGEGKEAREGGGQGHAARAEGERGGGGRQDPGAGQSRGAEEGVPWGGSEGGTATRRAEGGEEREGGGPGGGAGGGKCGWCEGNERLLLRAMHALHHARGVAAASQMAAARGSAHGTGWGVGGGGAAGGAGLGLEGMALLGELEGAAVRRTMSVPGVRCVGNAAGAGGGDGGRGPGGQSAGAGLKGVDARVLRLREGGGWLSGMGGAGMNGGWRSEVVRSRSWDCAGTRSSERGLEEGRGPGMPG